jgi:hypothetical protein
MTAANVARIYLRDVWSKHGLPLTVTSDRGRQFVSQFMSIVNKALHIGTRLSSSYHPETDGQSERSNQAMEQYLRAYVNENQDDWVDWLPMAEFAANNHVSESTGVTPFYANVGRHPRMVEEVSQGTSPSLQQRLALVKLDEVKARDFASRMLDLQARLRKSLALAQATYTDAANLYRRVQNTYNIGDEVYVSMKNLPTTRASKSLDYKYAGPYKVTKVINNETYRLDLPSQWKINDAFHTALL